MKLYVLALKYSNWYQLPAISASVCNLKTVMWVYNYLYRYTWVCLAILCIMCVVIAMVMQSLGHQLWIRSNYFFLPSWLIIPCWWEFENVLLCVTSGKQFQRSAVPYDFSLHLDHFCLIALVLSVFVFSPVIKAVSLPSRSQVLLSVA